MKPDPDGWNLVVMGHWDPLILTPKWIGEHVATGEVTVDLPTHQRLPPRLRFDGVSLLTVDNRLVVGVTERSPTSLEPAESAMRKLLQLLPHTPITGVGVNLRYAFPRTGAVTKVLAHSDDAGVAKLGTIEQVVVRRRVLRGDDAFNLTVESAEDGARVSVNVHRDATTAAAADAVLGGKVAGIVAEMHELLRALYAS